MGISRVLALPATPPNLADLRLYGDRLGCPTGIANTVFVSTFL